MDRDQMQEHLLRMQYQRERGRQIGAIIAVVVIALLVLWAVTH